MEHIRIDRWLWAVRLFKTRSGATAACRGGHVRLNGARVKPAAEVRVGDTVVARTPGGERVVEVARLIQDRVGAPVAVTCFHDHTPPPEPGDSAQPPVAVRGSGTGRPSKRDRRALDRMRGPRPR